jgi:transposase
MHCRSSQVQGQHHYQPELFATVDIESLIPKNHLLRKIDAILDLSFLRDLTSSFYSKGQGRPSVDPEIFIRMILVEYFYNVDSDRQLCEEIQYNLAFRWFCRLTLSDKVPDHSSLTRIRDRLGEETFCQIFLKIVDLCREKGLVKGERIMTDGSLVDANASVYSLVKRGSEDDPANKEKKKTQDKENIQRTKKRKDISGEKFSNETHVSVSDPEATLAGKRGARIQLRYKTHSSVDADTKIILDCHVTTGNVNENIVYPDRIQHLEETLELNIKEVIADRAYGTGENLDFIKNKGIQTFIPLFQPEAGKDFNKEVGFEFDREKIEMKCPQGYLMNQKRDLNRSYVFTLPAKLCRDCSLYESCLKGSEVGRGRGKVVRINRFQHLLNEVAAQEKTPEFRNRVKERFWKMEGIFAEAKNNHGLKRARYRGLWKMQMQLYMISSVQNLKRLASGYLVSLDLIQLVLRKLLCLLLKSSEFAMNPRVFIWSLP